MQIGYLRVRSVSRASELKSIEYMLVPLLDGFTR